MLQFQELTAAQGDCLRRYYEACDYRLCEYSLGVKLMWRGHLHPFFAEAAGCLIVRNRIEGEYVFDYPILSVDGDGDAALRAIEGYCAEKNVPLVLSVVPEDKASQLVLRGRQNSVRALPLAPRAVRELGIAARPKKELRPIVRLFIRQACEMIEKM